MNLVITLGLCCLYQMILSPVATIKWQAECTELTKIVNGTGPSSAGDGADGDGADGDGAAGDGSAGDGVAGDDAAGDGVAGDGVAGDGAAGNGAAGDGAAGDGAAGDGAAGNGAVGDGTARNSAPEDGTAGDDAAKGGAPGDGAAGDGGAGDDAPGKGAAKGGQLPYGNDDFNSPLKVADPNEEAAGDLTQPEECPEKVNYVDHSFYKSALVCNKPFFNAHWKNITSGTTKVLVHPTLANVTLPHAYRDFSIQMPLLFKFPFYGHYLSDITISTGGYLFTGSCSHHWFSQEQNISPLMANFDVSLDESSAVVLYEEATRVTIVWENMKIREKRNLRFTFAVTLYKNGDIYFAYKDIPIKIQCIDKNVFVGISDSYFLFEVNHYVRRKTIHNYSRIPFNAYNITSDSVLQLIAQRSCPIYNTCRACTGHEAKYGSFKCMWCKSARKCTSGADYFRPYMADCSFSRVCNSTSEDNETLPLLSFFQRAT